MNINQSLSATEVAAKKELATPQAKTNPGLLNIPIRIPMLNGGEGGIRTHGRSPYAGFQDQYLKPLGHLSLHICVINCYSILSTNNSSSNA